METIYFKGEPCHTYGTVPTVGTQAPKFKLTGSDLSEVCSCQFAGKRIVLNIFPSLDTPVCAMSVRKFNKEAADLPDTVVINVSNDLPFAMGRFCAAEGIDNAIVASAFRSPDFAEQYGLTIVDGPLAGLLARAVIVIDEKNNIIYRDLVNEITDEPYYKGAVDILKNVK